MPRPPTGRIGVNPFLDSAPPRRSPTPKGARFVLSQRSSTDRCRKKNRRADRRSNVARAALGLTAVSGLSAAEHWCTRGHSEAARSGEARLGASLGWRRSVQPCSVGARFAQSSYGALMISAQARAGPETWEFALPCMLISGRCGQDADWAMAWAVVRAPAEQGGLHEDDKQNLAGWSRGRSHIDVEALERG
jgi:hypothetical protein